MWGCSSVVECLLRMREALGSNPSISILKNFLFYKFCEQNNPELGELRLNGNRIRSLPESLKFNKK